MVFSIFSLAHNNRYSVLNNSGNDFMKQSNIVSLSAKNPSVGSEDTTVSMYDTRFVTFQASSKTNGDWITVPPGGGKSKATPCTHLHPPRPLRYDDIRDPVSSPRETDAGRTDVPPPNDATTNNLTTSDSIINKPFINHRVKESMTGASNTSHSTSFSGSSTKGNNTGVGAGTGHHDTGYGRKDGQGNGNDSGNGGPVDENEKVDDGDDGDGKEGDDDNEEDNSHERRRTENENGKNKRNDRNFETEQTFHIKIPESKSSSNDI